MEKIPERYKKLQTRFDLPSFKELRDRFKLDVEEEDKLFDQIRNEMSEKLFSFSERIIEPIISGAADSFCCLFEQDMITKEERQKLFDLYKKIQTLKWESNVLVMRPDEKQTAAWIKLAWDLWNTTMEAELVTICKKFSVSWKNMTFTEEKTQYHG